jgi:putative hydrolase of the HAD superfamily
VPPSWEQNYRQALTLLAGHLGVTPHPGQLGRASAVLRSYNTRLHPREHEVPFAKILSELLPCFGVAGPVDELASARAFFEVYRQKLRCFDDSRPALEGLRGREKKIGVFTDAPYGMPRELVLEDVQAAGLAGMFDLFLTSVDTGVRKPSPQALRRVAHDLGCKTFAMTYVGNEQKDIEAAKAAGCRAVLIDRNDQRPAWGQDRTIRSLLELWVERGWF